MKRKINDDLPNNKKIKRIDYTFIKINNLFNLELVLLDPTSRKFIKKKLFYNFKNERYSDVFGEKNLKICKTEHHIKKNTKFIIVNNIHFGCKLILDRKKLIKVIPFNNHEFIFFKVVKLYDIPMYIIFRKYRISKNYTITPLTKIIICEIGDVKYSIDIKQYKTFKFLPQTLFKMVKIDEVNNLFKTDQFRGLYYFCFSESENIFQKDIILFYLKNLKVQKNLMRNYEIIFKIYENNLNVKNIFIGFIELEKFIKNIIPTYCYLNVLTSYPFELFFQSKYNPLVKAINYLKLKHCYIEKFRINRPGIKTKIYLSDYQEVFELYKRYEKDRYQNYLDGNDRITQNGFIINKEIFEIDIWSCYGNCFLNIYENGGYEEFKVLYKITKFLLNQRRNSNSEIEKKVCKLLVNAGCYGSLNMIGSKIFPLYPSLMKDIVINAQKSMKQSIEFLEKKSLRRVFSKNDSHLLVFKKGEKYKEVLFDDILLKLNILIKKSFPNTIFKLRNVCTNGVWFNQNTYILKKKDGEFIIKGMLNSLSFPKTIRDFFLIIVNRLFNGEKDVDFDKLWEDHKLKTMVTLSNFTFKERDEFYVFVKGIEKPEKINLACVVMYDFKVDAEHTYTIFKSRVVNILRKVIKI